MSSSNSNSRIDPSQMPRPDHPQNGIIYHTRQGLGRRNPPLSNSIFTAIDTGNCSPRYMRPTMVAPPGSKEILSQIGLPFAVLCTPFATPENGETIVPEVSLEQLPPRCTRCNAYINLYVQWIDGGDSWVCNMCTMKNATPSWYYSALDGSGMRMDKNLRPELQLGSVDFEVNKDYCIRDVQEPIYVFAIDISEKAIANGTTIAAIRAVQSCLNELRVIEKNNQHNNDTSKSLIYNNDMHNSGFMSTFNKPQTSNNSKNSFENLFGFRKKDNKNKNDAQQSTDKTIIPSCKIKASIITFNKEIQFYSINNTPGILDPIKIYVCGDRFDPLAPIPANNWLHYISNEFNVDTTDSSDISCPLDILLRQLPELIASLSNRSNYASPIRVTQQQQHHQQSQDAMNYCCVTAAIKAVQEGLEKIGGNLIVITSSNSNHGFGSLLTHKENINYYGTKEEINLYGYSKNMINDSTYITDTAVKAISSATTSIIGTSNSSNSLKGLDKSTLKYNQLLEDYKATCLLYNKLADECSQSMLCLNIVTCIGDDHLDGGEYIDTKFLGDVALTTGGKLHFLTGAMTREENVYRLEQQLVYAIQQSAIASEAVIKLRSSIGVRVESVLGPGVYSEPNNELECCSVHTQSTFMFTLNHDSTLKEDEKLYLQLAVLYTTINQRRKVRIHNLMLTVSNKPTLIFRNSDIEAVVVSLVKIACDKALTYPLEEDIKGARAFLDKAVTNALHKYRLHCSPNSPKGQLILPESLKVLPIYSLGMLKHPALLINFSANGPNFMNPSPKLPPNNSYQPTRPLSFTPNNETALSRVIVRAHERAAELRKLLCATVVEVINSLYPRVYNISDILENEKTSSEDLSKVSSSNNSNSNISRMYNNTNNNDQIDDFSVKSGTSSDTLSQQNYIDPNAIDSQVLKTLSPTAEVFDKEKLYLIDDRATLYLYIGRAVSITILESLFNISQSQYGRTDSISIFSHTELGRKLISFIETLRSTSLHKQDMKVIWSDLSSSKPLNRRFSLRLVEDCNYGFMSYVDYLCNMHTRIQGMK